MPGSHSTIAHDDASVTQERRALREAQHEPCWFLSDRGNTLTAPPGRRASLILQRSACEMGPCVSLVGVGMVGVGVGMGHRHGCGSGCGRECVGETLTRD